MQHLLEFDHNGKEAGAVLEVIEEITKLIEADTTSAEDKKALAAKYTALAPEYNTLVGTKVFNVGWANEVVGAAKKVEPAPAATTGEAAPARRKPKDLSDEEKAKIRERITAGEKQTAIAADYNVHPSTIADVKAGRI